MPLVLAVIAAAQSSTQDKTLPPPSEHSVLTLHATGSQTYACQRSGNDFHWIFVAPAARLFDDTHNEVAIHADGPVWIYQDGSAVHGTVQVTQPSPDPASIPWLLLKAVNPERTGILTTVDYIRRSDTQGGVAPATGCDTDHEGSLARVPYTAVYTFYSARP